MLQDNCYFYYSNENSTDIILKDRMKEFNRNNLSLCEPNCVYKDYNSETKKVLCECNIKNEMVLSPVIINNQSKELDIFNPENIKENLGFLNMGVIKCIKVLFSKVGFGKNISSYIFIFFLVQFIISFILYCNCGYIFLEEIINSILSKKEEDEKTEIKNEQMNEMITEGNIIKINNNKNASKNERVNILPLVSNNLIEEGINSNNSNFNPAIKIDLNPVKEEPKLNQEEKKEKDKDKEKGNYDEPELNALDYTKAIIHDKRTFIEYYFSLIKRKNIILFAFYPNKDYNSIIIKLSLLSLSFSIFYFTNFAFFNEDVIHEIYLIGGKYDISFFIPKILLAFIISYFISNVIQFIFLSERNILKIKKQNSLSSANNTADKVKNTLYRKYVIFYLLGILLLIFFWLVLSIFGAVYQTTQIFIIKNTLISFAISNIYTLIISIIPSIIRIKALKSKEKNKGFMFKLSRYLQIL